MSELMSSVNPFGPVKKTLEIVEKNLNQNAKIMAVGTSGNIEIPLSNKFKVTSIDCNPIIIDLAKIKLDMIHKGVSKNELISKLEKMSANKVKTINPKYNYWEEEGGKIKKPLNDPVYIHGYIGEMPHAMKKQFGQVKKLDKIDDFDAILLENITHLQDDIYSFLKDAEINLKKGGKMFVVDYNETPPFVKYENGKIIRQIEWGENISGKIMPFEEFMQKLGAKKISSEKIGNKHTITIFEKKGVESEINDILSDFKDAEEYSFVSDYNSKIKELSAIKKQINDLFANKLDDLEYKQKDVSLDPENIDSAIKWWKEQLNLLQTAKKDWEMEQKPETLKELIKQKSHDFDVQIEFMRRDKLMPFPTELQNEINRLREKLAKMEKKEN